MVKRHRLRWPTIIEVLLIFVVLCLFTLLITPIHFPSDLSEYQRQQLTCLDHVRELAIAVQTYSEDHNDYCPGMKWVQELSPYIGNKADYFHCPSDSSFNGKGISYGYSGLLLSPDGKGIYDHVIQTPEEVGVICDSTPTRDFPNGGIIGGGGLQPTTLNVTPIARHANGLNMGYADGHAKYIPNGYNPKDLSSDTTCALFTANAYGLIDNPSGGISDFPMPAATPSSVTIDGEPCTQTLLRAAADVWGVRAKADIKLGGFDGQYAAKPCGTSFLWGTGDGQPPALPAVAIARDLVVVITARASQIKMRSTSNNGQSVMSYSSVCKAFHVGFQKDALQAYTYNTNNGTRKFFSTHMTVDGHPLQFGAKSNIAKDDFNMVDKVSNDPYGIGYCSSAIADLHRVQIIGLQTPDGKVHVLPFIGANPPGLFPATPPADWPLVRTLYACYGGNAWNAAGTGIANVMFAPGATGTKALQAGPLFQASYWQR